MRTGRVMLMLRREAMGESLLVRVIEMGSRETSCAYP